MRALESRAAARTACCSPPPFSPADERLLVLPMDGTVRVLDSVAWSRRRGDRAD